MTQNPVKIDALQALFSEHFMGDSTNNGAWRIAPRVFKPERSPSQWFLAHARDNYRKQFWNAHDTTLTCMDAHEVTALLIDLETEYRAWSES